MNHSYSWPSVEAFLEDASKESTFTDNARHSRMTGRAEWFGDVDFQGALKLARFGWKEGAAKLAKFEHNITPNCGEKAVYNWDVTGEFFDVATVLTGNPECWMSSVLESSVRCIDICVSIAVSSGVNADTIMRRGAAICALVDTLDYQRIRTSLSWNDYISHDNHKFSMTTQLKAHEQPLDMDRVAFGMAHPASLRRTVFSFMETTPDMACCVKGSYGRPLDERPFDLPKTTLFIPPVTLDFTTDEGARAWLAKILDEVAVKP